MARKEVLDAFKKLPFPSDEEVAALTGDLRGYDPNKGESHRFGKEIHPLKTYEFPYRKLGGFRVTAKYNWCEKCGETRNAELILYDTDENRVYIREFVRNGDALPQEGRSPRIFG